MRKLATTTMIMAVAIVFMIAGFAFACNMSGAKKTTSAQLVGSKACQSKAGLETTTASATDENIVLNVTGMTCNGCVKHITKSLAAVEGVSDVVVSLDEGTAKVAYDASQVKPEALTSAVVDAGYKAEMAQMAGDSEEMMNKNANVGDKSKKANARGGVCAAKKSCDPAACPVKTASSE